jgi:hypothetical protein
VTSKFFFEKVIALFSRKISTFVYGIIGSIDTFCGVLSLVKISAQLLKSPSIKLFLFAINPTDSQFYTFFTSPFESRTPVPIVKHGTVIRITNQLSCIANMRINVTTFPTDL